MVPGVCLHTAIFEIRHQHVATDATTLDTPLEDMRGDLAIPSIESFEGMDQFVWDE